MHIRYKNSLLTFACFMALSVAQGAAVHLSATEADNQASALAERGGGGGRGGGGYHPSSHYQGEGAHENHGNYPGERAHENSGNYNHDNFNRNEYNHDNFNHDNWNRNNWDAAGWGAGALDVVPPGEYVYPGTAAPVDSGDMNTLYDYDNSNGQSNPSN